MGWLVVWLVDGSIGWSGLALLGRSGVVVVVVVVVVVGVVVVVVVVVVAAAVAVAVVVACGCVVQQDVCYR